MIWINNDNKFNLGSTFYLLRRQNRRCTTPYIYGYICNGTPQLEDKEGKKKQLCSRSSWRTQHNFINLTLTTQLQALKMQRSTNTKGIYIYICSVTRTEKQDWATFDQNFLFKGVYKTDFFYYMFFVRLFLTFLPLLNHTQNNNNKNKSNKYIYIVSMEKRGSANMCDPKIAKWKRIVKKKNSFRFVREA